MAKNKNRVHVRWKVPAPWQKEIKQGSVPAPVEPQELTAAQEAAADQHMREVVQQQMV